MSEIRVVVRRYERPANQWVNYDQLVTYPDDAQVQYDMNQHTLVIRVASGEPIAVFTNLSGVLRDDLVTVVAAPESALSAVPGPSL